MREEIQMRAGMINNLFFMRCYVFCLFVSFQASSRHQCSYLVSLHSREFVLQGGDHQWLRGVEHIPQKLRDLAEMNKLLAHRPWLINKAHIGVRQWLLNFA